MELGRLTLQDPRAALVALAALLPLLATAWTAARSHRVARSLRLEPAPVRTVAPRAAVAVASCLLLALAAARPELTGGGRSVRTDAEVFFIVDVSRSMLAAPAPGGPTRLARAKAVARALRDAVPEVPAGAAGLTDRVLPYAFPTADGAVFAEVVERSVAVETPPPRGAAVVVTSFDALGELGTSGFFSEGVSRRTCVIVTDGESRPFVAGGVRGACRFLVVRVGGAGDRVFGAGGVPEPQYRPDPGAGRNVQRLASATGGRAWPSTELGEAAAELRASAGAGPSKQVREPSEARSLAAFPAAAALLLVCLLGVGVTRRRRIRSDAPMSARPMVSR